MIPEPHREAVTSALQAAFGIAAPDAIRPLTEGMSQSLVYRLEVRERPYVLRIHLGTKGADPTRHFTYLQPAAEVGIAPRVHYMSVADKIVITDFVDRQPFPADMIALLAPVLRRLHALPLYYGAPPTPGQRARFELIRITEHVFYAVFLAVLARRRGAVDDGAPAEDFHAFHDHVLGGAIMREPGQQLRYAKAHAAEGARRVHSPRFREWLVRALD